MGMNVFAVNQFLTLGPTDQFFPIWKLSRVMKSCGYLYKGSSNGTVGTKESTGAFLQDTWGPGGIVSGHVQFGTQTGTTASVTTISGNIATVTGLSGMTTSSVGHALTLSGATNTGNNGTFTIVSFISSSSVTIFNANPGVVENTSAITWSERISGSASITWSAVSALREQTITGLSGMTTNSAGHYLYLTGSANSNNNGVFQVLKYVSATSVVIVNTAGGSDTASGNWTELDPLLDVYPTQTSLGRGSWILFQGPSTLKIPINAPSTGTFTRGENITQSGSGAQGELLGYQYDVSSAQGYLVVSPRQDGSGAGALGWSIISSTITGGSSGATVTTANGSTPIEYVRETVFWQGSAAATSGTIYQCIVDGYAESTNRFSSLLGAATPGVAPGGGTGANVFPSTGAYVVKGQANGTTGTSWFSQAGANYGRAHIFAANADYTANSSADGNFTVAVGMPSISPGAFMGLGFWRVDNNEDGDVDPYVWFCPNTNGAYSDARAPVTTAAATSNEHFCHTINSTSTWFRGWRRRGFSTNDMFQQFQVASISAIGSTNTNGAMLIYGSSPDSDSMATSLATFPPRVRDPIWIVSTQTTLTNQGQPFGKMRKGTLRWAFVISGANGTDTFDNKKWVQFSNNNGAWTLGPWDGVSVPLQT